MNMQQGLHFWTMQGMFYESSDAVHNKSLKGWNLSCAEERNRESES